MLKCPFCGFDYSEHGLRDGRCGSCGSVIAWESGSGDVPESIQQAILAQTIQLIRPGSRPGSPAPSIPRATPPSTPSAANGSPAPAASSPGETPPDSTAASPPSTPASENREDANRTPPTQGSKTAAAIEKVIGKTASLSDPMARDLAGESASGSLPGDKSPGSRTVALVGKTHSLDAPPTPQGTLANLESTLPIDKPSDSQPARLVDKPPEVSSEILRTITPAALSPDELSQVAHDWGHAVNADDAHPRQTLKGHGRGAKVSDTQLVIQTRSVVNKQENSTLGVDAEYELLNVIGKGGVGVVYLARQSSIDRDVAVKMLRGDRTDDPANRDKFLAEAVVTGDLDHPNIVPIYDLGTDPNGALFYSMKRVQGTPWDQVMRRRTLAQNLEVLLKVSDAIAFAHARGIVHRDIKAENIMLGEFGEVLVMDWGIALPLETYGKSSTFLRAQGLGGSPAYMSPEMVTGPLDRIGPPSDVYLLGATLFEIVTGRPPHAGRSVRDCLLAAARNEIVTTDKSGELLEIALRAMATRIEDRYPNVQAFQSAVREYESHAESVLLSTRAAQELADARASRSYEEYSRAVFGFQEALELWKGNRAAKDGLPEAKLAYAEGALEKGDFDLGLSLLDPQRTDHRVLYDRLRAAVTEREARQARLRYVRRLVVALILLIFVGGAGALVTINNAMNDAVDSANNAELERKKAVGEQQKAVDAQNKESRAKQAAIRSRQDAERAAVSAQIASREAENQRQAAEDARQQVEESSYFTEINVVAAKIRANSFDVARQTLQSQSEDGDETESASRKARYRHWEWARLSYLCGTSGQHDSQGITSGGVRVFHAAFPIEAFALSSDDGSLALGAASGDIELRSRGDELLAKGQHPGGVAALAFSSDGRILASGGRRDGTILLWLRDQQGALRAVNARAPLRHGGSIRALAFAHEDPRTLLSAADNVLRRWAPTTDTSGSADNATWQEKMAYHGHLGPITCVDMSRDGRWLVTASEDSTVRLWNAATGSEVARFRGHEGTVFAVAFAPDGTWFASAGFDRRVLLWNMPANIQAAAGDSIVDDVRARLEGKQPPVAYYPLVGHSASIRALSFSRENGVLVSAGQDNTAIVWNAPAAIAEARGHWSRDKATDEPPPDSSALVKVLRGHGTWIRSSAVTRDGSTVLTHSNDGTWREWDVAAYDETRVLHDADYQPVTAARYVGDGRQIVTAHGDGTVRLWEANSGRELARFTEGHEFLTTIGQFFPEGGRLLTSAGDGTTRIWDATTFVETHCLHGTGRRGAATITRDGKFILTAGTRGTSRWWDAATGKLLAELPPPTAIDGGDGSPASRGDSPTSTQFPEVTAVSVASDNARVLTGDAQGRCWLWTLADARPEPLGPAHSESVSSIHFLPDAPWVREQRLLAVSAGLDGQVRVWRADRMLERARQLTTTGPIDVATLSPDGRYLVCAATIDEKTTGLWWWDVSTGQVRAQVTLPQLRVNSIAFRQRRMDEVILSVTDLGNSEQDLRAWSVAMNGEQPQPLPWPTSLRPVASRAWNAIESPDGTRLLTVGGSNARVWDAATGRLLGNLRGHSHLVALDVSRDGKWLLTAGAEGAIKLWDMATRTPLWRADVSRGPGPLIASARFSPDGRRVLVAAGNAVNLWDTETGNRLTGTAEIAGATAKPLVETGASDIAVCEFSPDGRYLLVAPAGERPTVWELTENPQDGSPQATPRHRLWQATTAGSAEESMATMATTRCAAFSADGQWLITGGDDRIARLWSAKDGRYLASLAGHSATITCVTFSADGLRALTGSDDARVMLWDTRGLARVALSDPRQADPAEDEESPTAKTREILTLSRYVPPVGESTDAETVEDKTHEQRVTAVAFAPHGRDVLTASSDGTAMVWPGTSLDPALDLSLGKATFVAGSAPAPVDSQALVMRPAAQLQSDFALRVTVTDPLRANPADTASCELSLVPAPIAVGSWELRGNEIVYRAPLAEDSLTVGNVEGGREGEPLVVVLRPGTPGHLVEAIVRSVSVAHPIWTTRNEREDEMSDGSSTVEGSADEGSADEGTNDDPTTSEGTRSDDTVADGESSGGALDTGTMLDDSRRYLVEFRSGNSADQASQATAESRLVEFVLPSVIQSARKTTGKATNRGT